MESCLGNRPMASSRLLEENVKLSRIIEKFGLKTKDLDDVEVGIEHVIVHREYKKWKTGQDYRSKAVEVLLENRVSFSSEGNIFREVARRVMQLNCPYCFKEIKVETAGGSPGSYTIAGECQPCKVRISLTAPPDGFSITIKDEE
jgi:hypothetical protein